ncbi:MAG: CDP-diacylglycerol--serine O-phosphatidyltransferase [Candidatus Babeliales bacterium]|jgi:CDP-diacylglycerol--serine O-phosphatidyltransferase
MAFARKIIVLANRHRRPRLSGFSFPGNRIVQSLRVLPNLFTIGNALCGFGSIVCAGCENFKAAAMCVLAGAVMDSLDGRIARYTNFTSNLGLQLDSLSDAVTFCLAPALLAYTWQLNHFGWVGFVACGAFLAAGLLRLARFNLTQAQQTSFFTGTPTPIAGCFIATVLLSTNAPLLSPAAHTSLLVLMPLLAILMISSIPFPTFKKTSRRTFLRATIGLLIFAFIVGATKALLITLAVYFIFAIEEYIRTRLGSFRH